MKEMIVVFLGSFAFMADAAERPEPLMLVDRGKCLVSIVNVGSPAEVERNAADVLQDAFEVATGARPEINPARKSSVEIRLGVASSFSIPVQDPSEQAYAMRRVDGHIELVGNTPVAAMWAVADFCDRVLNVSWPTRGTPRRTGPQRDSLSVDTLDVTESPDIEERGWGHCENMAEWMAKNRQNMNHCHRGNLGSTTLGKMRPWGLSANVVNHSFSWLITGALYDEHPEYFPLIDGQRKRTERGSDPNFCVSNPDVAEIIIEKARGFFLSDPTLKFFPVVGNDNGQWCECDACREWDGKQAGKEQYSNRLFRLVNRVAEAVADEFPGRYIGTLSYWNYTMPPDIEVAPNVALGFCMGGRNYLKKLTDPTDPANKKLLDLLKEWLTRVNYVFLWEYYGGVSLKYCPLPIARTLAEEYGELAALGVKGIQSERPNADWELMELVSYTAARSGWDTDLSYEGILEDYCRAKYGPAAEPMKAYHLAYEQAVRDALPEGFSGGSFQIALAGKADPEVWETLDGHIKQGEKIAAERGEAVHVGELAKERAVFDRMRRMTQDPRDIPGIGPNLLWNPGAEDSEVAAGWFQNLQAGRYEFSVDEEVVHSGKRSLKIACMGKAGWARWAQLSVPAEKGQRYVLSVWVRGKGGTLLAWQSSHRDRTFMWWEGSEQEWQRIVLPEIVAEKDSIMIALGTRSPCTVYYDDVFFAKLP